MFLAPEAVLGREHRAQIDGDARVEHVHDVSSRARTHAGVVGEHGDARFGFVFVIRVFRVPVRPAEDAPRLRRRHLQTDEHPPRPSPREPTPERVRRDRHAHRDAPGERQRGGDHGCRVPRAPGSAYDKKMTSGFKKRDASCASKAHFAKCSDFPLLQGL